jgi:hypothetical protein
MIEPFRGCDEQIWLTEELHYRPQLSWPLSSFIDSDYHVILNRLA